MTRIREEEEAASVAAFAASAFAFHFHPSEFSQVRMRVFLPVPFHPSIHVYLHKVKYMLITA